LIDKEVRDKLAFTFSRSAETPSDETTNPKKITMSIEKAHFFDLHKTSNLECAEDLSQMAHMLLLNLAVNQHIIKICHYEFIDKRSK